MAGAQARVVVAVKEFVEEHEIPAVRTAAGLLLGSVGRPFGWMYPSRSRRTSCSLAKAGSTNASEIVWKARWVAMISHVVHGTSAPIVSEIAFSLQMPIRLSIYYRDPRPRLRQE